MLVLVSPNECSGQALIGYMGAKHVIFVLEMTIYIELGSYLWRDLLLA
jgi:hypothetical protein